MDHILAIDIGTTNCKAITFDCNGQMVLSIKNGYLTYTDDNGKSEQNPDEICDVVLQLIQQSLASTQTIKAVCFSAAMHSLIAVNKDGKPITNAIIWSDTRAAKQAERLKKSETGIIIYHKTGTPVHPMSPLCKIIWLKETMPDIFDKTHKFISIKEYIFFKLFGKYIIDYSIASATGLFDIKKIDWCSEAMQEAGILADTLSKPVDVIHAEKNLLPLYKYITSGQSVSFVVGGNDGCLANLGSGVINAGDASLTVGTSGAVRMTTKTMRTDEKQRTFTYLLTKNSYISGGAINNGGVTLEWLSRTILHDNTPKEPDELLQLAETAPAGADNLLFLPYLLGERAPMWDATAKGVLFGITQHHTEAHIARAAVEGICFAMRDVLEATEDANGNIKTIFASGGFTQSQFWLQTMADIVNKKIVINNSADASATGAAIIGLYAMKYLTGLSDSTHFFKARKTYYPTASTKEKYDSLFAVFQTLYPKLKDSFAAINNT